MRERDGTQARETLGYAVAIWPALAPPKLTFTFTGRHYTLSGFASTSATTHGRAAPAKPRLLLILGLVVAVLVPALRWRARWPAERPRSVPASLLLHVSSSVATSEPAPSCAARENDSLIISAGCSCGCAHANALARGFACPVDSQRGISREMRAFGRDPPAGRARVSARVRLVGCWVGQGASTD